MYLDQLDKNKRHHQMANQKQSRTKEKKSIRFIAAAEMLNAI